jgi:hypothetical protein
MKNKSNTLSICLLLAVAFGAAIVLWAQSCFGQEVTPAASAGDEKTESENSWAKYQIILQRNIFSRQRGPIRQRRERARSVVTRNPESYLVLKGLVEEDGTFIAFVENTQNNTVFRLREGQRVARGTVKNFTLDSIEYHLEGKAIGVTLGRDLEGKQGTLSMNRLLELSASTLPVGDPNAVTEEIPPSAEEEEILKKLMEQRKQQLGQ